MKSVNALELRQSLGKVLRSLERDGSPIVVERARRPSAVLISIKDYNERFVDRAADEERRAIVRRIEQFHLRTPRGRTSLDILRALRSGQ